MHRTAARAVRARSFFSFLDKQKTTVPEPSKMTKEEQEKLRSALPTLRTDSPRQSTGHMESVETDDIIDQEIDMDSIRARSLMPYRYNYNPPSQVPEIVLSEAARVIDKESVETSFCFNDDNKTKAKVIIAIGERLKHYPLNSRLHRLKTLQDVVDFYQEPVQNITEYNKLARSESLPPNVYAMEHPVRFHPKDEDAWHGGITAFPGTGGQVLGLRNKRILRQFQPKQEWFDYEDGNFDYSPPEKDMPWDAEVAKRMDRYPNKRYNLQTKAFSRTS